MRMSDWSSDLCSSDLNDAARKLKQGSLAPRQGVRSRQKAVRPFFASQEAWKGRRGCNEPSNSVASDVSQSDIGQGARIFNSMAGASSVRCAPTSREVVRQALRWQIGRASGRERVCQYG